MAVTIVSAKINVAGSDGAEFHNAHGELLKVSGTIANTDTGTYRPTRKPILDAGGIPVIVGLPHGIQPSFSTTTGLITFTASAGFTALNVYAMLLCEK